MSPTEALTAHHEALHLQAMDCADDVEFEHYETKERWESGVARPPEMPSLVERLFYDIPYPKPKRTRR